MPIMPCCPPKCGPPPKELGAPGGPGCSEFGVPAPSPEGRGLLRESISWVWEEEGVACAEPDGELEAPCDGDEVPELESFFLVDFSLLARESCSC